jgi:hypothetical protein
MRGSRGELDGQPLADSGEWRARIDSWWARTPDAGIACALRYSPFFVLDVDARNGGHVVWEAVFGLDAPTPLICESGSGWPSAHYWFVRTPRLEGLRARSMPRMPGVDIKGLPYGYVVLPPTVHPKTGVEYSWYDGCDPAAHVPAILPEYIENRILDAGAPIYTGPSSYGKGAGSLDFPRAAQLRAEGIRIGKCLGNGRWIVECPNAAQHTTGTKPVGPRNAPGLRDSSTVLMAPAKSGGTGRILCLHSHCEHVR